MVDNRMIDMIELQQVLEGPRTFVIMCFDIIHSHRMNVDSWSRVSCKEARDCKWQGKGGERRKHSDIK